ncbi:MAG: Gfo/Idh/MocA family oxidoreductase, partial [Clostridia bacterium]|nr:Gfo/Idh/MocA family oxidoreductase [Clostridia bacterium]
KYRVFDDMLDKAGIDAVIIGTPMQCHVPQAIAAMEAGIHVMSEVTAASRWTNCSGCARLSKSTRESICMPRTISIPRKSSWSRTWWPRDCSASRITLRACTCTTSATCSFIRTARRRGDPSGSAASAAISTRRTA